MNSISVGFSQRCVWQGSVSSRSIISPSPARSSSEHEMANRGVRIGWTRAAEALRLRGEEPEEEGGEVQRDRTKETKSSVSARLCEAYVGRQYQTLKGEGVW